MKNQVVIECVEKEVLAAQITKEDLLERKIIFIFFGVTCDDHYHTKDITR